MAVRWEWKEKVGEFTYNGYTVNLYEGNAFLIGIDEFKMSKKRRTVDDYAEDGDDCYRVAWFFIDKQHAKRCLGLEKGSYDMFEGLVDHITLYLDKCKNWKDIITMFGKTQKDITFTIKATEGKEVA